MAHGISISESFSTGMGTVYCIAIHADGRMLIAEQATQYLKMWDLLSKQPKKALKATRDGIMSCAINKSGSCVAYGGIGPAITISGLQSCVGAISFDSSTEQVRDLLFHPTSDILVSCGAGSSVEVWHTNTGKCLHRINTEEQNGAWSVAYNHDATLLACGGSSGKVYVWSTQDYTLIHRIQAHSRPVFCVAFGGENNTLATASADTSAKIYCGRSAEMLAPPLLGHLGIVDAVSFSPDGKILVTQSQDGSVRLWECKTWRMVGVLDVPVKRKWVAVPRFWQDPRFADEQLLVTAGGGEAQQSLHIWRIDTERLSRVKGEPVRFGIWSEKIKATILFMAASPLETRRLDLEEELHSLEYELRAVNNRDQIVFIHRHAVRPDDVLRHVREESPTVIHFSGHGSAKGIVLRNDSGGYSEVGGQALASFLANRGVRLVVLNACYSKNQADYLADAVGAVVGTTAAVGDEAARRFSTAFYRSLGNGLSIREAFRDGRDAVVLHGLKNVFWCTGDLDITLCG